MGGASRFILLLSTPFSVVHPRPSVFRLARHSLTTLSTTAPHFLITPSRTYRTTSLIPFIKPKASQPIHTQPNTVKEPWPEWYRLIDTLSAGGYFDSASSEGIGPEEDAYVAYEDLPQEFLRAARACLTFARNRPDILGSLSRRDIEVIVENGTPFLFKSALDTARRMRSFLHFRGTNVLESDKAQTVDLMKYLLSYASNPTVSSERNNLYCRELIESSVRNLLSELVEISSRVPVSGLFASGNYQVSGRHGQSTRPIGQSIEMKRGDWICPKCSFMNFARNAKCLECEEHRPKREITRGEWECPQCDFYNYGRNMVCLRCDCKRPGEAPFGTANSTPELGHNNGDYASKADVDSRLAANEEKARRWFTNVSQSNNVSDSSSTVTDEDFPEIMPSRKGVNRFVVSPRKTPLERRFANSQHQRNLRNNDGILEGNNSQTGGADKTLDESIGRSLDQILGQTDTVSPTNEPENSGESFQLSEKPASPAENQDKDEEAKKSERWFKRVAELHDVKDLGNAISDEDFPEIMPMRKGENRFVISKKKDRSLTSPMYKRQMAMEQASNTKFVPFVPFPPNYFAKKQQPAGTDSTVKSIDETSSVSVTSVRHPEKSDHNARIGVTNTNHVQSSKSSVDFGESVRSSKSFVEFGEPSDANPTHNTFSSQNISNDSRSSRYMGKENNTFQTGPPISGSPTQNSPTSQTISGSPTQNSPTSQTISNDSGESSYLSGKEKKSHQSWEPSTENPTQNSFGSQSIMSKENVKSSGGWIGKSLEGSAVKEPDPLDMSEEAKAERWFRRVAQIKDISELSNIPDEDFPSIMPMRKGVNRFVVSKRKTPLERRLTSPQYRRNLPIVTSDPPATNKKNDNNS